MMLERIDRDIAGLLMPKEEILFVASQSKVAPGGSISSPDSIYVTTDRVLFKDPKMFGLRANITAVKYEDTATVMLKRGVFSTEILLKPRATLQHIDLPAVDKQVALQISAFLQKGMRGELASSKKVTPSSSPPQASLSLPPDQGVESKPELERPKLDALDRLERLALMKHQHMITEEEFGVLKEELMLGIRPQISDCETLASAGVQQPRQEAKTGPANRVAAAAQQAAEKPRRIEKEEKEEKEGAIGCRYCGFAKVLQASRFCPDCGKDLRAETNVWKMCPICDSLATDDAAFCSACRQKFPKTLS